ncbi:asparagine--tRNA ligase [Plasmodium gonderi]|uniref:asparagine--tRNA ligase n=1 Tax=Plasmodium gonderi TaxID=77519 RepID=A0A1Y1JG14_PLAGO|nr:asparagine--tRNA ligase [Plasmodium gonderi]GAW81459.1 asparagine--tRNA ligase [Plasmodium gonderi]
MRISSPIFTLSLTFTVLLAKCIKRNKREIKNNTILPDLFRKNQPLFKQQRERIKRGRRRLMKNALFLKNNINIISYISRGINGSLYFPKKRVRCLFFSSQNDRTKIKDLLQEEVKNEETSNYKICGWVKSVRTVGKRRFAFIDINDGSHVKNLQVIVDSAIPNYEQVLKSMTDDAIECFGELKCSIGKKQEVELCVHDIAKEHYVKLFSRESSDHACEVVNGLGKVVGAHNDHIQHWQGGMDNQEDKEVVDEADKEVIDEADKEVIDEADKEVIDEEDDKVIDEADKEVIDEAGDGVDEQDTSNVPSETEQQKKNPNKCITMNPQIEGKHYAISKKYHTKKYLRNFPHLRARTKLYSSIFRLKSDIMMETFKFWREKNYTYINTPILTSNDCEGAGKLFYATSLLNKMMVEGEKIDMRKRGRKMLLNGDNHSCHYKDDKKECSPVSSSSSCNKNNPFFALDFFKKACYLNVSSQLALECLCCSMGDVFTINQSFRAEKSNTFRHLCEFLMLEVEVAFSNLEKIICISEEYIKEMIKFALYKSEDVDYINNYHNKNLKKKLENTLNAQFVTITYEEAIQIIKKENQHLDISIQNNDLSFEKQKFLTNVFFKSPVIVINYPHDIKPFYMKLNSDEKTVACMDILLPDVGELVGGSEREIRMHTLQRQMERKNLDISLYEPYIQLRRYGNIPHSGFGLGIDRLIMFLTSIMNIRDVVPFPRAPDSLFM